MSSLQPGAAIFISLMQRVRDDLKAAVQGGDVSSFNRITLMPGAIAWDDCDQCGLLALAQTRLYLSDEFPIEAPLPNAVQASLLVGQFVVQAIRCAPTPDENGNAPSVAELERSTAQVSVDQVLIMCTVTKTLEDLTNDYDLIDYSIPQSIVVGPEGACVGSELSFSAAVSR